jgi:hypothetical protein
MVENDDVGHVGQAGYNHLARVQAKVAQFHTEALTRDRALCGYSTDAQFCTRPRQDSGVECFCDLHQGKPRFMITRFETEADAIFYDKLIRHQGLSASAIWQGLHVVVGPIQTHNIDLSHIMGRHGGRQ